MYGVSQDIANQADADQAWREMVDSRIGDYDIRRTEPFTEWALRNAHTWVWDARFRGWRPIR